MNKFLTRDIRITKDSHGFYTASHKHQGILIDGNAYWGWDKENRKQCRRDAVKALRSKQLYA